MQRLIFLKLEEHVVVHFQNLGELLSPVLPDWLLAGFHIEIEPHTGSTKNCRACSHACSCALAWQITSQCS
jgi:hypothetical protein